MGYFLAILGIIASFFLVKYREQAGDMIGEADWMLKVGGVHNLMVIVAIFIFFWSVAVLTGTTDLFFGWVPYLFGIKNNTPTDGMMQ